MQTIANPGTLGSLIDRLKRLQPDSPRRWGTLTPGEMLCHLADAHDSVLGTRVPPGPASTGKPRPLMKWFALSVPLPWPKGIQTRPGVDPKLDGTHPGEFEQDRERTISGLKQIVETAPASLTPVHIIFGPMSASDWYRWGYLHVDHHLRQFSL